MSLFGRKEEVKNYKNRYYYLYTAIILFFFITSVRIWFLQVYKGEDFYFYAEKNRMWQEKNRAPRGLIYDRNGKLLVDNRLSFDIVVRPQFLDENKVTVYKLSKLLKIPSKEIFFKIENFKNKNLPPFSPVTIVEDASRDEVAVVESNKTFLSGVDVLIKNKRTYLYKEALAHVLGYIGQVNRDEIKKYNPKYKAFDKKLGIEDEIGKFGLEKKYDFLLRGIDGANYLVVDARGRMISDCKKSDFRVPDNIDYLPGKNLNLTIDLDLQMIAYKHFKENDKKGAVLAINPKNGEVLVMMSAPGFDPNILSKGISKEELKELKNNIFRPFYNKTIQDHYSPGSIYKPLVALAALEDGIIDEDFKVTCYGNIRYGRRRYHCHRRSGHGKIGIHEGIVKSCDVVFYKLGMLLGADKIHDYAVKFGLSQKTEIDLLNETTGLIPSSSWKEKRFGEKWQPGENLSIAIGQSYNLVTPIQMANLYGGIAHGKIYKPHVLKSSVDLIKEKTLEVKPSVVKEIDIDKTAQKTVLKTLWGVVNESGGTARWYKLKGLDFAGKTGTVQLFRLSKDEVYRKCEEMEETKRHHGWFVGMAPYDDPDIVVAVIAEHSCHGSSGGAPIARDIIKAFHKKYGFSREKEEKLKLENK
jgi:penicillin-binding protein 2